MRRSASVAFLAFMSGAGVALCVREALGSFGGAVSLIELVMGLWILAVAVALWRGEA